MQARACTHTQWTGNLTDTPRPQRRGIVEWSYMPGNFHQILHIFGLCDKLRMTAPPIRHGRTYGAAASSDPPVTNLSWPMGLFLEPGSLIQLDLV